MISIFTTLKFTKPHKIGHKRIGGWTLVFTITFYFKTSIHYDISFYNHLFHIRALKTFIIN